jgi:MutS domain I
MFDAYQRMRGAQAAILAWQMGDWFEFYGPDATIVAEVCGIALGRRGSTATGEPLPMCGVSADTRFLPAEGRLLIPLTPTHHFFGQIVEAGHPLAVAVYRNERDGRDGWEIAATFDPADFTPSKPLLAS